MKKTRMHHKGFTLIELLIVIAIIGILAGVVLVSTSSSRTKAKNAKALSAMQSITKFASICVLGGKNIVIPASATGNPGSIICTGETETYPDISDTGFYYHTDVFLSDYSTGMFAFTASNGGARIVCASNVNIASWYGMAWNFTGTTGCKTNGF